MIDSLYARDKGVILIKVNYLNDLIVSSALKKVNKFFWNI